MTSGGGGRGGNGAVPPIPAAAKKIVLSLREIVNCPENEIYAMLKECNMDPNETVSRLLSQDTFHEVKSKREKKKDFPIKESSDSKPRGASSSLSRGGKSVADRSFGRSGSSQLSSSSDTGGIRAKSAIKKENGGAAYPSFTSSASSGPGNNSYQSALSVSNSISTEGTGQRSGTNSGPSAPSQSSGYQSAWAGLLPGQLSMADIVKRGSRPQRPPNLPSSNMTQQNVMQSPVFPSLPSTSHHNLTSSQASVPEVAGLNNEPGGLDAGTVTGSGSSPFLHEKTDVHLNSGSDELQMLLEENKAVEHQMPVSTLESHSEADDLDNVSHYEDSSYNDRSDYLQKGFEHQEVIGGNAHLPVSDYSLSSQVEDVNVAVSSAAADLQQLSLQKEEVVPPNAEGNPAVIMPNHFQVSSADCAHLSFGSFGSGVNASYNEPFANKNLKNSLENSVVPVNNASSIERPDVRKSEYYGNDQLRSASNENVDSPSSSQPEVVQHDPPALNVHGQQYAFPTAVAAFGFENSVQANTTGVSSIQSNSQMHNLAHLSSVLQPYTSSLPSALLASTVQPVREADISYSPFSVTQSMPTKYSSGMSSISGGSTLSVPEGAKPSVLSTHQLSAQTLPTSSITQGPVMPQHLPVHQYSPPSLPLGFANMIGYPFLPQTYPYLPYAAGSSAFHQSPAAVPSAAAGLKYSVPQYKNSISGTSLPQGGAIASGYGGSFGNAPSVPGNFNLNASANTVSTTLGYDDVLSSQFKDSNHYVPLQQQNEGSNTWVHGPNSRTISTFPASTYYSFQNQNQSGGFRQGQQPSPYGALGYPNFYHSQAGVVSQEHQPPSDGTLGTSQGPTSQQSHQIWQHSY